MFRKKKKKRQQTEQMYVRYLLSKNSLFVAIKTDGVYQHAIATCSVQGKGA
jgi:hypothetical protein